MASDSLQFRSWGFELFVPPIPLSTERARFVMLDDLNDKMYEIDYETLQFSNKIGWVELALHTVTRPALVFPPGRQNMLNQMHFAVGLLVSIESRDESIFVARNLGSVIVKPLPQNHMNWSALKGKKGPELPAEMRAGLLRRLWRRSTDHTGNDGVGELVTPSFILSQMSRKWHLDGVALSHELDGIFVGGKVLEAPSRWRVSNLDQKQIENLGLLCGVDLGSQPSI